MNKLIKVFFVILMVLLVILFSTTIIVFANKFWTNTTSGNIEQWGQTGDYFGGILNPIISLMSLIVLSYLTLRVSEIEHERARQSIAPLPDIIVSDYQAYLRIDLRNQGLGPMLIKRINFKDLNTEEDLITKFLPKIPQEIISEWWDIRYDLIIPTHSNRTLLALRPMDTGIVNPGEKIFASYKTWGEFRPQVRNILKEITIEVIYVDNIDPTRKLTLTKKLDAFRT